MTTRASQAECRNDFGTPEASPISVEGIPPELKERPQWVAWREAVRDGKTTKIPVNVRTGGKAAVDCPDTWAPFAEALAYYQRHQADGIEGLGFVLTKDDPYIFIDLDKCLEPGTGAVHGWALEVVQAVSSYTEISPSGQGLHLIAKGSLPPGGRRKGQVEMYDRARYMTMTGKHFRFTPTTIEERQGELEALHSKIFGGMATEPPPTDGPTFSQGNACPEAELIEKAHQAANGEKFGKLWRGDWEGAGYPSQSEADLALCSLLAFWTQGDTLAIDRLFRQSGLFRDKWDERHYADGRTYGQETIRKALVGTTEFYKSPSEERGQANAQTEAEDCREHYRGGDDAGNGYDHDDEKAGTIEEEEPKTGIAPPPPGWPDPLRKEALYGLAGDFVKLVEPHTEADPVALLTQFLTAFGNIIGNEAYFQVEANIHHLKLFVCLVGETSKARKGTSYGHVRNIYHAIDSDWAKDRIMSGLVSGEGLIWQVRNPIIKLEPVKEKGRLTGEYSEIIVDPGVNDKRLLVYEPEFASTLRVMGREGNILSTIIRQAWDGPDLRGLAKNSPGIATGAHISIIAHITKNELIRYLDRTEAANGFGNRFLWVCVRRSKLLPEGGRLLEVDFGHFLKKLADPFTRARQAGRLSFDEEARRLWREIYGPLSEGKPGMFGSLVARAEAQVVRLACIYGLLDQTNLIRPEHLQAALAVWDYAEASVLYIFGDATGDPVADQILSALRDAPMGLSQTDISNLFGRNLPSGRIHQALTLLLNQRLVVAESRETGGRRAIIWKAVTK
jgi:hypothetical protein